MEAHYRRRCAHPHDSVQFPVAPAHVHRYHEDPAYFGRPKAMVIIFHFNNINVVIPTFIDPCRFVRITGWHRGPTAIDLAVMSWSLIAEDMIDSIEISYWQDQKPVWTAILALVSTRQS